MNHILNPLCYMANFLTADENNNTIFDRERLNKLNKVQRCLVILWFALYCWEI